MNNFIHPTDYDATVHRDILDSVTRSDASLLEICEDRAVAEMRSYMSGRYDCDQIFSADVEVTQCDDGTERVTDHRHPLILMMAIDIAVYHLFSIHNPQKMSQIRIDRYNRAIEWLQQVSKMQIAIEGAPTLSPEETASAAPMRFVSNPKRHNHL